MNEVETNTPKRRISPRVRWCLIVMILIGGLVAAKTALFPEHPDSWYRIHDSRDLTLSEVRDILSASGARLVSTVSDSGTSTETWRLQHSFGAWTVLLHIYHPPSGDQFSSAHVRYDSIVFPRLTRMRNYPNPQLAIDRNA